MANLERQLNILVVSQYFWPENFRINDLVSELCDRGHQLTVLTGMPNYPDGFFFKEFLENKKDYDSYKGADIVRVPMFARGNKKITLIANYLSFFISATIIGYWKLRKKNFDVIFVFQGSPVTSALPAIFFRRMKRIPIVHWVLDLWPDTLKALGIVKSPWIYNRVGDLVSFIYRHSDLVLGQSKAFDSGIATYCSDHKKIKHFYNWSEEIFNNNTACAQEINPDENIFKILFAGNIGDSQGFPALLQAVEILKSHKDIHWYVVGDGRSASWVNSEINRLGIENNITLLGRYPLDRMPSFYSSADVMLVTLKKDPVFSMTIPGKLQSYMAAGKPILGILDGEGARVIEDAKCGLSCGAGCADDLAKNVLKLKALNNSELVKMGINGKLYADREFNRELQIDKLEQWFYQIIDAHQD